MYEPKLKFLERMQELFQDEKDYQEYLRSLQTRPLKSIRCNTIKISSENLKNRLEKNYSWSIRQPFRKYPEIFIIESQLTPGELGRALEHQLGYYYVQETASMLPILALNPNAHENILDLAAAPGSKTSQAAAKMKNTGLIIANDKSLGRMKILSANLQRLGVSNTIITQKEGEQLCHALKKSGIEFDKILLDAPCSGEGTFRDIPKGMLMWNPNTITKMAKIQKRLIDAVMLVLKSGGELVYSTCTHAPEENEEIIQYALEKYPLEIQKIELPIRSRHGIKKWQDKEFKKEIQECSCRIYPHDNNTEGFFLAKMLLKKKS
jgi:NOL1/NOP2/sun family putative RNA methylase